MLRVCQPLCLPTDTQSWLVMLLPLTDTFILTLSLCCSKERDSQKTPIKAIYSVHWTKLYLLVQGSSEPSMTTDQGLYFHAGAANVSNANQMVECDFSIHFGMKLYFHF